MGGDTHHTRPTHHAVPLSITASTNGLNPYIPFILDQPFSHLAYQTNPPAHMHTLAPPSPYPTTLPSPLVRIGDITPVLS